MTQTGPDTTRKLNALMERRHTAGYKSLVPVEASDVAEFKRPRAKLGYSSPRCRHPRAGRRN